MKDYEYKQLLDTAHLNGITVATRMFDDCDNTNVNGVAIAFKREVANGKMFSVAVSYCNAKDQFSRRKGITSALNKWFSGECVQIPFNLKDDCDGKYGVLSDRLLNMFMYR